MGDTTKLTLSDKELSMVNDAEWILTKQAIIQKVYALFAACIPGIKQHVLGGTNLPPEVITSVPKIYKGENYLQLPYVMLDYPRCFNGDDIFAIRTMFWWGNFFSVTLHLSGKYKIQLQEKLEAQAVKLDNDFFVGINDDQWAHHFDISNYISVDGMPEVQRTALLTQKPFLKLALKFKLDDWNGMDILLTKSYAKIAAIIA